jgi:FkbM family methyltransferase
MRSAGLRGGFAGLRRALDRRVRKALFVRAPRMTAYLAVKKGRDLVFLLPTVDRGIALEVFVKRGSRNDMKILGRAVRALDRAGVARPPDPVFVDVGANIGTTTIMALRRRGFATAVAIEPWGENFRTLRLNLVANNLDDRVKVFQVAASDVEGDVWLEVSPLSSGCHRIGSSSEEAFRVEAVTLDGLVARGAINPERVGLLWMDTQGHEASVLQGASKLLEVSVPLVTAARNEDGWDKAKHDLGRLLSRNYTHVQNLRKDGDARPISELPAVLDAVKANADLLLFRL